MIRYFYALMWIPRFPDGKSCSGHLSNIHITYTEHELKLMLLKIYGRIKLNVLSKHFVFYILKGEKKKQVTSNIIDKFGLMF